MSKQTSFYQLIAQDLLNIEIPIIQRDYAQGRKTAAVIREDFLRALYQYLEDNIPGRDLDFVYGDSDGKDFIPLDGQQRLTTLFLLHWYLAIRDCEFERFRSAMLDGNRSRFRYTTRQTSTDFCDALIFNTLSHQSFCQVENQAFAVSTTIQDEPWYFSSWNNDPTIQSMLCMLDSIHFKFRNADGFYQRIARLENPIITFQFLSLSDYSLTDDLYIKMNSRGKPLTQFENFKARYEKFLTESCSNLYLPPFDDADNPHRTAASYFSHQMDTKWMQFFWPHREGKDTCDEEIMNFITTVAINHIALTQVNVKTFIDHQKQLPLDFYTRLDQGFVSFLIKILDLFSEKNHELEVAGDYTYFDVSKSLREVLLSDSKDTAYLKRIQFFAYTSFMVQWSGETKGLWDWMRVICNLSNNTAPYNDEVEFVNSIRAIHQLLPFSQDIRSYLRTGSKFSGFNPTQIHEEQMKAHLIGRGVGWADLIFEGEQHAYFSGQLSFALAFSGVELDYKAKVGFSWNVVQEAEKINKVKLYIEKVFSLFDQDGIVEEAARDHKLHRAVLSKGNYLIYAKSNLSFLNNSDRDVSWRRFLFADDATRKECRKYFQDVIDDVMFQTGDYSSLEAIAKNYDQGIEAWRKVFIEQPELFHYLGKSKYIRMQGERIYLLRGIKMNGEHAELYSLSLFERLKSEFPLPPFRFISYVGVSGDYREPYFVSCGRVGDGLSTQVEIMHMVRGIFSIQVKYSSPELLSQPLYELYNRLAYNTTSDGFKKAAKESEVLQELQALSNELNNYSATILAV